MLGEGRARTPEFNAPRDLSVLALCGQISKCTAKALAATYFQWRKYITTFEPYTTTRPQTARRPADAVGIHRDRNAKIVSSFPPATQNEPKAQVVRISRSVAESGRSRRLALVRSLCSTCDCERRNPSLNNCVPATTCNAERGENLLALHHGPASLLNRLSRIHIVAG